MADQPETFDICVQNAGTEECFPSVFSTYGYSYRITVKIDDVDVIFEPDEERNFRGRIESNDRPTNRVLALVPLLGAEIEKLFKDNG